MSLTDIVIDIHQRETGELLSEDVAAELRELAGTFGVVDEPGWLLPMFTAVQEGLTILQAVFIECESSDPDSYLFELAHLLNWAFEYDEIEFPRLGWRIYVNRDARSPITGRGGSTYKVTPLSVPSFN